jgi:hypothetical protein
MDNYDVMARTLTSCGFLSSLTKEDRDAAMNAANAFVLVSDFLEGKAPSQVNLDVLIEAEKTYERLLKAVL